MKITKSQLTKIIKEELALVKEAGDPIGPVEAQKMAELLQNLGFTLTRGGMNSFIEFLQGLENAGDLNASPDTRRGALAELALVKEEDGPFGKRSYDHSLVSNVSKTIQWEIDQAFNFVLDLLEDVNAHAEYKLVKKVLWDSLEDTGFGEE